MRKRKIERKAERESVGEREGERLGEIGGERESVYYRVVSLLTTVSEFILL